jgi:O-antigen/teichoic acid export membrane protein
MFSNFHEDKKMITETLITMSKILLLISIGLAVFVFFNANWINQLLYHQNSIQMDQNLKIIMIGFIPASYSYLFGALMQSIHRENKLAIIYFAMMILNAICNLIFIPKLHSYGAAIALLITQIVVVVVMVYHTIDRLDNKLFLKFISQSLSFMLVNIILHYFIYNYFTEQSEIVYLLISTLLTLVLGVIFKLIDLTELKELYKKKEIK